MTVSVWPAWLTPVIVVAWAMGIAGAWYWARGALLIGTVLIGVSVLLLRWPRSIWAPTPRVDMPPSRQRWGLLAVCAVATFFRCYQMEPPGLWGDDAINGLLAFDVLDGVIRSPLKLVDHSYSTFHALSNYIIAGSFLLFGPDPLSIRVPGIIANLLAVPLLYSIVSPLYGPRVALIAALFFASSPFELGNAKSLLQNILGQSFEIAGLCLLIQGALRGRRWMLIAAGIPIALALYTYHAAKLVPFIAAFALWQVRRLARARGLTLGRISLLAAAAFALCATPAVRGYIKHPDALTGRLSGVGLGSEISAAGNLWPLWDSVWRTLAVFHYQQGPIYHWFGIGTEPGASILIGGLVVHGLVQSLRHWRQPAHALLLGWFALGLIPGFLSSEAPRGYRILIGAPVVFIWAALPVARVLSFQFARGLARVASVAALALLLAAPMVDFNYYFYRVYTSPLFRWFQAEHMMEMARELRGYGPGWTGYIVADNFTAQYETMRFLARAWKLELRDVASFADALPVRDESGAGALFMIMRTPFEGVAVLPSLYPDIALDVRREPVPRTSWFDAWFEREPPPQTPTLVAFFPVSREAQAAAHGLAATYASADRTTITSRIDPQPLLRSRADLPAIATGKTEISKVVWHGSVLAAHEGLYQFRLESSTEAMLLIDSEIVATHEAATATRDLASGLHELTVAVSLGESVDVQLFWRQPGEDEVLIPPAAFFNQPPHGVLAEYQTIEGRHRRIEPFPFYLFFAVPFPGTYSARWSGRLQVPRPGKYALSIESDRAAILEVDGHRLSRDERLSAGIHALAIAIDGIEGAPRLRLYWQLPERERELIPPEAFEPRDGPTM